MTDLLSWDIYEFSSEKNQMRGMKIRGRVRKFGLVNSINVLAENDMDDDKIVRFAVLSGTDATPIKDFIKKIIPDAVIVLSQDDIKNPVLSKMKVNIESRYEI